MNIVYPICAIGGIMGSLYGFSYSFGKSKNEIATTFPRLNNNYLVYYYTFALKSKDVIFYTGVGLFYGILFPLYPTYKLYKTII